MFLWYKSRSGSRGFTLVQIALMIFVFAILSGVVVMRVNRENRDRSTAESRLKHRPAAAVAQEEPDGSSSTQTVQ